jgi:hypothetical protein
MKKGHDVAAAVEDVENHYIFVLDAVNNDVLQHRETTQAGA